MRISKLLFVLVTGIITLGSFNTSLFGQEEDSDSRYGGMDTVTESKSIVLTRRANNNAYGTSAYSFRTASQDVTEHRNYVDLVYNGCGSLHFNPCGGMRSEVADLGALALDDEIDLEGDHNWADQFLIPQAGHLYLHKIRSEGQTMTVKFRVDEVQPDKVSISWAAIKEVSGAPPAGMAGTMGQCGGPHMAR